jgi:catechol 2,3-dioxygenase-like lactoylglutathione lyase family enzyme
VAIVERVESVLVVVRDVDAAFEKYTRVLGFPPLWNNGGGEAWRSAGVSLGDAALELVTPAAHSPESRPFERALETRGEGPMMVALETADIARSVRELHSRSVEVTEPAVREGTDSNSGAPLRFRTAFIRRRFTPGLQTFIVEWESRPNAAPGPPGQGGETLKVKKLDHVVIATEDVEDSTAKWEHNLGLKADTTLEQPLGSGFKAARVPVGDSFLEFVQPVAEKGRFYEQFKERGEGFFSISVEVDDLDGAIAYLRGKGAKVSAAEPGIWPGSRVARVNRASAHGVSLQLIERG